MEKAFQKKFNARKKPAPLIHEGRETMVEKGGKGT